MTPAIERQLAEHASQLSEHKATLAVHTSQLAEHKTDIADQKKATEGIAKKLDKIIWGVLLTLLGIVGQILLKVVLKI